MGNSAVSDYFSDDTGSGALSSPEFSSPSEENSPPYLEYTRGLGKTYGTLHMNRRSKCWTIKAEPYVMELCNRLFPQGDIKHRGEIRLPVNSKSAEDISWLMMRYPLYISMSDLPIWQKELDKARQRAAKRIMAESAPAEAEPAPECFSGTLRQFQKEGLAFLLNHDRCLLADEMGLGKTVQALAAVGEIRQFPVLVIAPPHLMRNWQEETLRFLRVPDTSSGTFRLPRVHRITGLTPYELPEADVYFMHYLLLRGWKNQLPQLHFPLVIFDEIQELRHAGTEKYSAASLLSESSSRVFGLSGTPIYNHGGEIWNIINILDFHFLGDYESFSRVWCTGYGGDVVTKPQLLGEYLKQEGLMLRRTKEQVLKELPPKRRLVQELDWNDRTYVRLMEPVLPKLLRWKTDGTLTGSQRAMLEENISQEVRQATGIAKAPYVCQFVSALLDAGEKVLLFAHHHQVMDIYRKELSQYSPKFITGREGDSAKAESVSAFMEGKTSLLCISLRSGSGLNLQRATCVVFGELDWSPAVHSQAEDRAHRIGQEDSILCYYLVAPQGSDAAMQEALGLKVSQFVSLMGDKPQSQEEKLLSASVARERIEMLVKNMAENMPEPEE